MQRYDIIGDVHGCALELVALLREMQYDSRTGAHRAGRKLVFVGDLVDRGPYSLIVLLKVMSWERTGHALVVPGNHDDKLGRWAAGRSVKIAHGLARTIEEIANFPGTPLWPNPASLKAAIAAFFLDRPYRLDLDDGRLVVVHGAALEAELQALEMRLAEVRVLKGQHHEAALRLRKGADALHETVYGSVPVAPVATALLDALATRKVVPLRGQALSPGTRFETKHDLGIFDDPSAYPQVQEG